MCEAVRIIYDVCTLLEKKDKKIYIFVYTVQAKSLGPPPDLKENHAKTLLFCISCKCIEIEVYWNGLGSCITWHKDVSNKNHSSIAHFVKNLLFTLGIHQNTCHVPWSLLYGYLTCDVRFLEVWCRQQFMYWF